MKNEYKAGIAVFTIIIIMGITLIVSSIDLSGTDGIDGIDGLDFNSTVPYTFLFNGTQGEQGIQGIQGIQGVNGTSGVNGIDGANSPTLYLQDGLVLHMPFDGVSTDISGYQNGYTKHGASYVSGKIYQALNFNSSNSDNIEISSGNIPLNIGGSFTLSIWIKTSNSGWLPLISKGHNDFDTNYLLLLYNGHPYGLYSDGSISHNIYNGTSITFNDGTWHNIVFSFNGTYMNLYGDGVSCTTPIASSNNPISTSYICSIAYSAYNALYSNCILDECRIYNRALTQAEITALYNQPT